MNCVYVLQSKDSDHFYVGVTGELPARVVKHNAGEGPRRE
ncbi:MAG: GIY-YIG nuclease family protein [Pseudolabrys sp.]